MKIEIKRGWINQPSTLQELHSEHGKNVLAVLDGQKIVRVFFLEGKTISMQVPYKILALDGWKS